MITKERLEELIKQGATIYEYKNKHIEEIQLKNDWYVMDNSLCENKLSKYAFLSWQIGYLFETREEAEFIKEFGCIERTERLELPTWEKFLKIRRTYGFKSKEGKLVELFRNDNTIFMEDEDWNILREPLTKENYILACRKAKELFLGE